MPEVRQGSHREVQVMAKGKEKPNKVKLAAMVPSVKRDSKAEALHTRAVKEAKKGK